MERNGYTMTQRTFILRNPLLSSKIRAHRVLDGSTSYISLINNLSEINEEIAVDRYGGTTQVGNKVLAMRNFVSQSMIETINGALKERYESERRLFQLIKQDKSSSDTRYISFMIPKLTSLLEGGSVRLIESIISESRCINLRSAFILNAFFYTYMTNARFFSDMMSALVNTYGYTGAIEADVLDPGIKTLLNKANEAKLRLESATEFLKIAVRKNIAFRISYSDKSNLKVRVSSDRDGVSVMLNDRLFKSIFGIAAPIRQGLSTDLLSCSVGCGADPIAKHLLSVDPTCLVTSRAEIPYHLMMNTKNSIKTMLKLRTRIRSNDSPSEEGKLISLGLDINRIITVNNDVFEGNTSHETHHTILSWTLTRMIMTEGRSTMMYALCWRLLGMPDVNTSNPLTETSPAVLSAMYACSYDRGKLQRRRSVFDEILRSGAILNQEIHTPSGEHKMYKYAVEMCPDISRRIRLYYFWSAPTQVLDFLDKRVASLITDSKISISALSRILTNILLSLGVGNNVINALTSYDALRESINRDKVIDYIRKMSIFVLRYRDCIDSHVLDVRYRLETCGTPRKGRMSFVELYSSRLGSERTDYTTIPIELPGFDQLAYPNASTTITAAGIFGPTRVPGNETPIEFRLDMRESKLMGDISRKYTYIRNLVNRSQVSDNEIEKGILGVDVDILDKCQNAMSFFVTSQKFMKRPYIFRKTD